VAAYYNRIDDYIFVDVVGDTLTDEGETVPVGRYAQGDATLRGVEGRVEGELLPKVVVGAMGDLVRGSLVDGGPLPFLPAARLGALARWDDGRWSLGVEARRAFAQDRVSGGAIDIPTDPYTLVNLSAGLNLIRTSFVHSITLRVDNVLDERYRDAASRIKSFAFNPGRNLTVVYRVLF
jgi:iron complex outermembrane receptor protein